MAKRSVLVLMSAAVLAGCASGQATRSGFLSDYTSMESQRGNDSLLVYRPGPGFRAAQFHSVFIDRPEIRLYDVTPVEAEQLGAVFASALVKQFATKRRLVTRPGPGVLHVRSAITGARRSNVALNIATTSLLGTPISMGSVSGEAEIIDGGRGTRIAALSWTRRGQALTGVLASFARFGQVRRGLRVFARRLAEVVDTPASKRETSHDR